MKSRSRRRHQFEAGIKMIKLIPWLPVLVLVSTPIDIWDWLTGKRYAEDL